MLVTVARRLPLRFCLFELRNNSTSCVAGCQCFSRSTPRPQPMGESLVVRHLSQRWKAVAELVFRATSRGNPSSHIWLFMLYARD